MTEALNTPIDPSGVQWEIDPSKVEWSDGGIDPSEVQWDDVPEPEPPLEEKKFAGPYDAEDLQEFEQFKVDNPNLYGFYGVAEFMFGIGPAKMVFPERADEFNSIIEKGDRKDLDKYQSDQQLEVGTFYAAGQAFKGLSSLSKKYVAPYMKELFPKWYKDIKIPFLNKQVSQAKIHGAKTMELVRNRKASIGQASLDSEVFIRGIEKDLTKNELEAIPFIIEGLKDPNALTIIGRDDLTQTVLHPSRKVLAASKKISGYYDEAFDFLKKQFDNDSYINDYVTHMWDIPAKQRSDVANGFIRKDPFLKRRSIPSFEEGIKNGLIPKTTNIADILRVYDRYKIKSVFNDKFAKELAALTGEDGLPLLMRADKAPVGWVTVDNSAMNRAMMVGKVKKEKTFKSTQERIVETVEKIKTIERDIPSGGIATQHQNGAVRRLEEVMKGALEARGITPGEASVYLTRLRSAYAGANIEVGVGAGTERVTEDVARTMTRRILNEIEHKISIDAPILQKIPVKVHPDIAREVGVVFDKPFSHGAISALETVNAFTKKTMLTASLFHHWALTEAAFASGIGKDAIKMWNPYKIYRALKHKEYEVFKNVPAAKDGIAHGLEFGALDDVHRDIISRSLKWTERRTKKVPGAKQLAGGVRKANEMWDDALWDYYHNTLKLQAYESQKVSSIKYAEKKLGRPPQPDELTEIKRATAQLVNDTFGGQNWDLHTVFGNPKVRQMMGWAFLSPDWTVSTLRQAGAPIREGIGAIATKEGAKKIAHKATAIRATSFWLKAGVYWNTIAQSSNYYNTKKEYGEGRFTWDNPPGHEMNIFWGRNEDGTERYLRTGKQFREVVEYMMKPLEKIGGKVSPVLQEATRQLTKHNLGSGYPTEWAESDFWDKEALKQRGLSVIEMPIPFSLRPYVESRPKNFMFTFPSSRGMTNYTAVQLFREAIKDKSPEKRRRVYVHALENNLDAQSLFKAARSSMKADVTYDDKKVALEMFNEIANMDDIAKKDAISIYRNRNILTPGIAKQLVRLIKKRVSVEKQQLLLGIVTSNSKILDIKKGEEQQ